MISGHGPPVVDSLTKATVTTPGQLSVSSITTFTSTRGTSSTHSTETGAGLDAVGGVVSSTLITCVAVATLPQASVAVQVRVTLYSFGHAPLVVTSANVKTGTLQLSVAVGVAHDGVPEHSIVDGPGKPDITGGVLSSTLIVCEAVAVFPQPSSAVQVRVMLYSFGHEPLVVTSAKFKVGTPQLSVAVGTSKDGVPSH